MNRFFFDFNQRLDRHAALPAATFYSSTVPGPVRGSVHNVLSNLGGPVTVVNDVLEARVRECRHRRRPLSSSTPRSAWRASSMSPPIGALAAATAISARPWAPMAWRLGPYLVLPLRGPTAVRDFAGSYVDGFFSPLYYVHYDGRQYVGLVKSSLGSMDNRSANIITYRDIERASVDYYATMRAYYLQRRARQVEEKSVQTAELPDF